MANAKITALTSLTAPATGDVLAIVDDPAGTPVTKKITYGDLMTVIDVRQYGALGDGTDQTAAVQAAIDACGAAGGGTVFFPEGTYYITSSLTLSVANVRLTGTSPFASRIMIPLTGDEVNLTNGMIYITANGCEIDHVGVSGTTSTTANNATADFIKFEGVSDTFIHDIRGFYVNGKVIKGIPLGDSSSGTGIFGVWINDCHFRNCAGPLYIKGSSATTWSVATQINNVFMDVMTANECFYFLDAHDVVMENCFGSANVGSVAAVRVGGETGLFASNCDIGCSGSSQTGSVGLLLESSANGSPKVNWVGGVIPQTETGVKITSANSLTMSAARITICVNAVNITGAVSTMNVVFQGCTFSAATGTGAIVNLTTSCTVDFIGCVFTGNNTAAGTAYEIDVQATQPQVMALGCVFFSTAVTDMVKTVASGTLRIVNCRNNTTKSVFSTNAPRLIDRTVSSTEGTFVTITVPATTVAHTNSSGYDRMYYSKNDGTVTAIAVDGTATGLTFGSFYVRSRATITWTYTVVPTVVAQNL